MFVHLQVHMQMDKSLFIRLQGRIVQGGTHLWHFSIAQ